MCAHPHPKASVARGRARRCRGRTPPAPKRGTPGDPEDRAREGGRSLGRCRPANTGCCSHGGRGIMSRRSFSTAAVQQNPVSLARSRRRCAVRSGAWKQRCAAASVSRVALATCAGVRCRSQVWCDSGGTGARATPLVSAPRCSRTPPGGSGPRGGAPSASGDAVLTRVAAATAAEVL